jgi:hypothetical protein
LNRGEFSQCLGNCHSEHQSQENQRQRPQYIDPSIADANFRNNPCLRRQPLTEQDPVIGRTQFHRQGIVLPRHALKASAGI